MASEYEELFAQRGRSYDLAMQKYPAARDAEFQNLFRACRPRDGDVVLDLPSGGGYLERHLPTECRLESMEPSDQFSGSSHVNGTVDLEDLELDSHRYDVAICLAASHHIRNKEGLFRAFACSLKTTGHFVLADVMRGSPITGFLDEFSGRYNGTGHDGDYLGWAQACKLATNAGLTVIDAGEYACPWKFSSETEMVEFCHLLFGLRGVTDQILLDELGHRVGITTTAKGVQLDWRLLYITCRR